MAIDLRSQNREKKSDAGTSLPQGVAGKKQLYLLQQEGKHRWCYWSELEPAVMEAHLRGGGATLHAVKQPVRPTVDHL